MMPGILLQRPRHLVIRFLQLAAKCAAAVIVTLFICFDGSAQTTGSVVGKVTDPSGAVVSHYLTHSQISRDIRRLSSLRKRNTRHTCVRWLVEDQGLLRVCFSLVPLAQMYLHQMVSSQRHL
jgi:hypothetical protein